MKMLAKLTIIATAGYLVSNPAWAQPTADSNTAADTYLAFVRGPADIVWHRPRTKKEKPIVDRPISPETFWEEQKQSGG